MATPTHTVTTDALATLGTIIDDTAARDAIHLAVEPVKAGEKLYPGQHVSLTDGVALGSGKLIGIVDPFVPGAVFPDQMFWLVVYPRQITSLRHVWEHPNFPPSDLAVAEQAETVEAPAPTAPWRATTLPWRESKAWIEDFASGVSLDYAELMEAADDYVRHGNYLTKGGLLEGESVPDQFWSHYETVTGTKVSEANRGSFFSCSC